MYTLYKEGKEISADRDQLAALTEDGWSPTKPEDSVATSDEGGSDEENASGNKLESASGTDEDDDADPRRLDLE